MKIKILKSTPSLSISKKIFVKISCPSCSDEIEFEARMVAFGNIITCINCGNKTYYPFEKPWHKNKKILVGYLISLIISFLAGFLIMIIF